MSLLYMYRSITMYVTVLPIASKTYFCSPKLNETYPLTIARRVLTLMSGFGLSVNGKHVYCGDFIYSGHTVILVLSYLFISECKYTKKIKQKLKLFFRHSEKIISSTLVLLDIGYHRCCDASTVTRSLHCRCHYSLLCYN